MNALKRMHWLSNLDLWKLKNYFQYYNPFENNLSLSKLVFTSDTELLNILQCTCMQMCWKVAIKMFQNNIFWNQNDNLLSVNNLLQKKASTYQIHKIHVLMNKNCMFKNKNSEDFELKIMKRFTRHSSI